MNTFHNEVTLSKYFASLLKRGLLLKERVASKWSKMFLFRLAHFSEGNWGTETNSKSGKLSPSSKMAE